MGLDITAVGLECRTNTFAINRRRQESVALKKSASLKHLGGTKKSFNDSRPPITYFWLSHDDREYGSLRLTRLLF